MKEQPTYPDSDLLLLVVGGDEAAFAVLVNRYWRNIYLQSLAYVKDNARAEEITQDVFLSVWTNRSRLGDVQLFSAWLNTVARNRIISSLRTRLKEIASLDESAYVEETSFIPDQQAEYRQFYALMLEGIERLPPKRREVFKLSRIDGLTNLEIAERLDIHPVTVSQYLAKSFVFLRSWLANRTSDAVIIAILLSGKHF